MMLCLAQVSLVGWPVEEGLCRFNIKSNFLLGRRETEVRNNAHETIQNTPRRDGGKGIRAQG